MKKRHLILPLFLIVWLMICGVALGFMVTRTSQRTNQFVPAKVACEIETNMDDAKTKITGITVESKSDVEVYVRVRLVSYWIQEIEGQDQIVPKTSQMQPEVHRPGWIPGSEDTYYYYDAIEPGQKLNFLDGELVLETEEAENDSEHPYRQVVEAFAEVIQANPAKAAAESWKITISPDNGTIMTVP